MQGYLVISKGTEFFRFPLDALVCVTAEGNFSIVLTVDGHKSLLSLQLGQVEALIASQLGQDAGNLVRIGRSLIINTDFVNHIDISRQLVVMSDCRTLRQELSASKDALTKLRDFMAGEASQIKHSEENE